MRTNAHLMWGQTDNVVMVSPGLAGAAVKETKQLVNIIQPVPRVWSILFSARIVNANFDAGGHAAMLRVFPYIVLGLGTTSFKLAASVGTNNNFEWSWNLVGNELNQLLWIGNWQQPVSEIDGVWTLSGQGLSQFPACNVQCGANITWFTNTPGDTVTVECNALAAPIGGDPNL